jgi:hypothetical protein
VRRTIDVAAANAEKAAVRETKYRVIPRRFLLGAVLFILRTEAVSIILLQRGIAVLGLRSRRPSWAFPP